MGLQKYDSVNGLKASQYLEILKLGNFGNEDLSELIYYSTVCEKMGGIFWSESIGQLFARKPFQMQNKLTFEEFIKRLKSTANRKSH